MASRSAWPAHEMAGEIGDLRFQVVFHCQLGKEHGGFDFEKGCRLIVEKMGGRHPPDFGRPKGK